MKTVRRRDQRISWLPLFIVGLVFLLSGCGGSGLLVMKTQQDLKGDVQEVKDRGGVKCAPVEMAQAEASLAFAVVEMQEGDSNRARQHLHTGEERVKTIRLKLAECEKRPAEVPVAEKPKDSDGDGIVDGLDECPDRPEDFDGVEDDDGCPDGAKDRDGDGIVDELDRCPDEPEDMDGVQDEDGCPDIVEDRDGDGIADADDKCPDQAEDLDRYQDKDGCPDVDNDGDGLFDVVDKCPDEAEDVDGYDDEDGCPDTDNDNDGFADAIDNCPTEAETPNGYEDDDGCPDTKPELPKRVTITANQIRISEKINFKVNSDVILEESFGILDDVVKVLKAYPRIKIRIEGHTDSQGSELYNLKLSKRRAASVKIYLLKAGIDAVRLASVGLGEGQPIDTNDTAEGRANNRRVEFHITEQ